MENKSFDGLPLDLVFYAEHQLGVAFRARNVDAAQEVEALGESAGVMTRLAAETADLVACASSAARTLAVVTNGDHAVAVQLESVYQMGGGRVATVGIYALPENTQVEIHGDDFDRLKAWNPSDPANGRKVLMGIVELWTSVSDPDNDLPVGRTAPIEKLEDGDYVCVQFVGLRAGEPPFMLFIEDADDIAQLMSSRAA